MAKETSFIESIRRRLGGVLEIGPTEAGLHLVGWLPDNFDELAVRSS